MFYKAIVIEGVEGAVEIAHTEHGGLVTCGSEVLCEVRRDEDRASRFAKGKSVTRIVYGSKRGEALATNSMLHDVLDAIDRVAGG